MFSHLIRRFTADDDNIVREHIFPVDVVQPTEVQQVTLNALAEYVSDWRARKGFQTPTAICDDMNHKLLRIHEEVTEAGLAIKESNEDNFVEEIADIVIRCMDLFGTLQVSPQEVIMAKMLKNERRPIRHGNKSPW